MPMVATNFYPGPDLRAGLVLGGLYGPKSKDIFGTMIVIGSPTMALSPSPTSSGSISTSSQIPRPPAPTSVGRTSATTVPCGASP
jgi:hypothetical protein